MRMRAKYVSVKVATTRDVAQKWRNQYYRGDAWVSTAFGDAGLIYKSLCLLGANPGRDEVAAVVGNKSWSYICCDGCNEYHAKLAGIGEDDPKSYCKTCLREALTVLEEVNHDDPQLPWRAKL
jgi:hypothetical protein